MTGLRYVVLFAAALLVSISPGSPSYAQNWPQRTVKFIVPLGPGSGVDIGARLFAEKLSQRWNQPVVVENRPGGDSIVAITSFLSSDDHTLLFSPSAAFTAHPFQHERLPYNYADLVPVARVSNTLVAVAVPASLPVSSVRELVELGRSQPGKLNWAGVTGALEFTVDAFLREVEVDIRKIPYRDSVQALSDLAEGRLQLYVAALAIVRPQIEAGRVKLLAITNGERAPTYPDIPTATEAGYPSLGFDGLVGVFSQGSMSADLRARISQDILSVGNDPAISSRLAATGQVVRPSAPQEFAASIDKQRASVTAAAARLGLKAAQE